MAKLEREIALKNKYSSDIMMSRLLECSRDIKCINYSLKHFGSADLTLEEIAITNPLHHLPGITEGGIVETLYYSLLRRLEWRKAPGPLLS